MAPSKTTNKSTGLATRSKMVFPNENAASNRGIDKVVTRGKRKAEGSPLNEKIAKRNPLCPVHITSKQLDNKVPAKGSNKPVTVTAKLLPILKNIHKQKENKENVVLPRAPAPNKMITRAAVKNVQSIIHNNTAKVQESNKENVPRNNIVKRLSNDLEKSEGSLYSTALEDISNDSMYFSAKKNSIRTSKTSPIKEEVENSNKNLLPAVRKLNGTINIGDHHVPEGIVDFDEENWDDIFQVSHYAKDIFNYYKEKEPKFVIKDYMEDQVCLTKWMRSLLVDWMVEIQESFELNHETLYLGVKLVDMYLAKVVVSKDTLQLVGAAAMFVASKFDERIPPTIDDFLYICDGAYKSIEMIRMEISLVRVIGFNLGIPISYRFLRRYARCAKIGMNILTLARFILEFSLMEYETILVRDSLLAAAALYLALKMKNMGDWTNTLEYYTGYTLEELKDTVILLNRTISKPVKSQLMTVRDKYSHKIFFEVAKTPLLQELDLF